jgi:hypothetical protein
MSEEHICVIDQRRQYERAQVCEPCRTRLPHTINEIAELWSQLIKPEPEPRRTWTVQQLRRLPVPTTNPARNPAWIDGPWITQPGHDPIAKRLPANAKPTTTSQRVSGSREAPVPVNLDLLDLTAYPRNAQATKAAKEHPEDQIGQAAVAYMLDQWCRDWRDEMAFRQSLPEPTVPELARFLVNRVEWACDRHPAIDDFAAEMTRLRAVLRGTLGLTDPPAEFCDGVVCRKCDRYALYREGDYVECDHCGLLYSEQEYHDWVGLLAGAARRAAV